MTASPQILKSLHLPFPEDKISWRAGARQPGMAQALPYIDNRVIMNTLDELIGPENWFNEYVEVLSGGKLLAVRCILSIRLESGWVGKSDAAPVTLPRENANDLAVKGAYSDAMKRAAVHWGLGRYLYAFSAPWVPVNERGGLLEIPALPAHMLPEGAVVRDTPISQVTVEPSNAEPALVAQVPEAAAAAPEVAAPARVARAAVADPAPEAAAPARVARPAVAAPAPEAAAPARTARAAVADPAPEAAAPARTARAAVAAPAPEADAASEVLALSEEQQTLVNGLLLRLGKLPAEMLRQYVEGPKGQEKLTPAARAHVLGKITAYEMTVA